MKAEYVINDTFDNRNSRPVGKIYRGQDIYVIETFIEAKRKYIAALLEFNEKHSQYVSARDKVERINNLIHEKTENFKNLDKTFNKIFKKSKLCNLKSELIKLQEEKELENSSFYNLKSRLIELEFEIIKQHEICLKCYYKLEGIIDRLFKVEFEYLFKTYNIEVPKSDDNYFDEEFEMQAALKKYLYTDMYMIFNQNPPKRLVK